MKCSRDTAEPKSLRGSIRGVLHKHGICGIEPHLISITVTVSLVPYGLQLFCRHRPMISRLVAIELCETACLSAWFFQKISQMGSIYSGSK